MHAQLRHLDGLVEVAGLQALRGGPQDDVLERHARGQPVARAVAMGVQGDDRGGLVGTLAVAGGRRHADVERHDRGVRQRRDELRRHQPVALAPRVKPRRQLPAPVAVGPLHAVALGDEVAEAVAGVLVEHLQPCTLRVAQGAQVVGHAGRQRAVDEGVAMGMAHRDGGVQPVDVGGRAAAAVQPHGGQQIAVGGVGQQRIVGAAPAHHAATRRLNSAAPQLITSSRSSGSLTGSATRAIGAQVDDPGFDGEDPGLGVVRGRGQDRGAQNRVDRLGREVARRTLDDGAHAPSIADARRARIGSGPPAPTENYGWPGGACDSG